MGSVDTWFGERYAPRNLNIDLYTVLFAFIPFHVLCQNLHTRTPEFMLVQFLNLRASSHDTCLRSTTEIADNWRLGRVKLAPAENQGWWTALPPSLLQDLVRGSVASSNGRDHRTPPFLRYSVHIHWSIKPKFGVHIAAASTYLLDQQKPLLLLLVLCSRPIMRGVRYLTGYSTCVTATSPDA